MAEVSFHVKKRQREKNDDDRDSSSKAAVCKGAMSATFRRILGDRLFVVRHGPRTIYLRNLVVGPLSEELVFRACLVPLLLSADFSLAFAVGISPLFFGLAHLHHLHRRVTHDHVPFASALATSLFQLAYTTLFGAYAVTSFLRLLK